MSQVKLPVSATCSSITISVINIIKNRNYDCSDCGFGYYGKSICEEKANFNLFPIPRQNLCATEVEIIITNNTLQSLALKIGAFYLIDSKGFSHQVQILCHSFLTHRYPSYLPDIHKQTKYKCFLTYPELEKNTEVSKIIYNDKYEEYVFEIDIAPFDSEATTSFYNNTSKPHSKQYYSLLKKIDRLKRIVFQRLNNILTKSEKIRLENYIMNDEFEIMSELKTLEIDEKQEIEKSLLDLMTDYRQRLIPANGNSLSAHERISTEGIRKDLGDTKLRSAWEANIARILNYKNIKWSYEEKTFMQDTLPYLPDFFLDDGTIIEVKGFWDNDSIAKVEALMRTKQVTNYLIVDSDMYKDLYEIYSNILPNWETEILPKIPKTDIIVVGLSFVPDKTVIDNLKVGELLKMEYEPNNEFDEYAIIVKTESNGIVGHIEKKFAPIYYQKLKLGMTFNLEITSIERKILRVKAFRNNWETPIIHHIFKLGGSN